MVPGWRRVLVLSFGSGIPRRSLIVAVIVGTILNLINQGDRLVDGTSIDWLKLILTYLVPYFVATYGAVSYQIRLEVNQA